MSAKKATKRAPRRRTRANTLWVVWSKKEKDLLFHWPARPQDGSLLNLIFCGDRCAPDYSDGARGFKFEPSFAKELEARGYDLTTLRFSIMKKAPVEEGAAPATEVTP
jgi:hypothetical protein